MRSDTLVLLHVLSAALLLGGLLTVAVVAAGGDATARLTFPAALLVLSASAATAAMGEVTSSHENADGLWLDVSSTLGYIGLLLPSVGLTVLSHRARDRPPVRPWITGIALAMVIVALAAAFTMAAKP
jgi:hypothetical protein